MTCRPGEEDDTAGEEAVHFKREEVCDMPGFDGSGPMGAGPMSGGGRGYCNIPAGRGFGISRYGLGRGFRGGFGRGGFKNARGYGRGPGWGRAYVSARGAWYGAGYAGPYANPYPMNADDEMAMLQNEAVEIDDRQGIIEDYLEILLPEGWYDYDIYRRREYVAEYHNEDNIMGKGKTKRMRVSVIEIWCEAFGKNKADLERIRSYEITKMLRRIKGWVCDGSQARDKVYGKQLIFNRVE